MLYRKFGKTDFELSALGIGTNRFVIGKNVEDDIYRSAQAVSCALCNGVNYIDVAYNYSKGYAFRVLQKAFKMVEHEQLKYYITIKSAYKTDKTAEDAYRRVRSSLQEMEINKAAFFVCWGVQSYEEYTKIIQPGGVYEGAMKAKKEGLIDSICFSTHAPVEDIIRIIEEGKFDGVTISYSALNYKQYEEVLHCAKENDIGIITMNSLGGGIIPQNEKFFSFLRTDWDNNVEEGALRFIYAHEEISCCLSGMSSVEEVKKNLITFNSVDEYALQRLVAVDKDIEHLPAFCSGCNYCAGCPQNIPIRELMQSLNTVYFPFKEGSYNRTDRELLENISITRKLNKDFSYIPTDTLNLCIHCGACESKCTQHLSIQSKLVSLYQMFEKTGYSKESQRNRLKELLVDKKYKKVAFMPGGGYTAYVVQLYREFFGEPDFDIVMFDNNSKLWGTNNNGIQIYNPMELEKLNPDVVIVANYIYAEEIYENLITSRGYQGRVIKLHGEHDVPWVF